MSRRPNEGAIAGSARGMTLVEVLISSALMSLIIGSVYLVYITMQDTMSKGELKADLQQNARVGLAKMTQEMRMAGYDPSGAIPLVTSLPNAAIRAAAPGCFSFLADVQGSNATSQITYLLDGNILRRRVDSWNAGKNEFSGAGGAQPLTSSVDLLAFTYYDANNQVLAMKPLLSTQTCPPDPTATLDTRVQLTFEQMRQIRRLAVTLKTRGSRPGVTAESFTLTSDVRLRNL